MVTYGASELRALKIARLNTCLCMVHGCRERFPAMGGFAMSANGDAARCDMRAGRIERCLAADMTVKERYALNKVAESSLCERMVRFREEDSDRFPAGRARCRAG